MDISQKLPPAVGIAFFKTLPDMTKLQDTWKKNISSHIKL